ncbi:MAG TPA: VOC family protein [Acidobacteriota bacterium]|nr:VOC family protein [Acidobacteriota bacterium]
MVKFGYAITYVDDVEAALTFYERAFGLSRRFLHESGDYGELDTGSTVLAFASHEVGRANLPGGYVSGSDSDRPLGLEIALVTDDVATAHEAALENGAANLKAPEQKPWGQMVSYVRCPSGVLLEICTPIGA